MKHSGTKVAVLFEGRNAAGKGGVIKRITQHLNPRVCHVIALGTPTEQDSNLLITEILVQNKSIRYSTRK